MWSHFDLHNTLELPPIELDARLSLSRYAILNRLLPALFCIFASAAFSVRNVARPLRVIFLPFALRRIYRAATELDVSQWYFPELDAAGHLPKASYLNQALLLFMAFFSLRCIIWTFSSTPDTTKGTLEELATFRDPSVPKPPEWRPTNSRGRFIAVTFLSVFFHILLFDLVHLYIHHLRPTLFRNPMGNVFLGGGWPTLESMHLTGCALTLTYATLQYTYDVCTLIGVGLLSQPPELWPPLFGTFYLSTSLRTLWGAHWHQLFRGTFLSVCGAPVYHTLTRVGLPRASAKLASLVSVFMLSSVFHWLGIYAMGHGASLWRTGGFFMANCLGIIIESMWLHVAGRHSGRTCSVAGWVWTMSWLLWWGSWMIDEWVQRGFVFDRIIWTEPDYPVAPL